MNPYAFESSPLMQTKDGLVLSEYVERQFSLIRDSIASAYNWEDSYTFSGKPRRGMMRYAPDGSSAPFDKGSGFYYYDDDEWKYIAGEIVTYGASISGTGNVWDDVNATDFTGHDYANGTCLEILPNATVFFGHNGLAYVWLGPREVCIGVGGNYASVEEDYGPTGTNDHDILTNRDISDQHPMSAITGLITDQTRQDNDLSGHESAVPAHTMGQIDGLIADQARQDGELVQAGYGGIRMTGTRSGPNITGTWQTITGFNLEIMTAPRGVIQDLGSDGLKIEHEGAWVALIYASISHNESNSGRTLNCRLYNNDTATGGAGIVVGSGRNVGVTNIQLSFLTEISPSETNDLWQLQVRSDDNYSSVVWLSQEFSVVHASVHAP